MIPLDIGKSSVNKMIKQGIPATIAQRLWENKILWLIVMHGSDIAKVRVL
jgi:hypothetical protein